MSDHYLFARIIRQFIGGVRQQQRLSPQQTSSCQNILNCHTEKLGGLDYACDNCARHYPSYHSCRHRHCPQCGQQASAKWVAQRLKDVLPVTYYHLVFTLPHELNGWVQLHPTVIYHTLFQSAWQTLNTYSQHNRQLEGKLGMSAVLHTWGQALDQHVHLHCLIPGGVINRQQTYSRTRRAYLYPERVLARLFRGKMVSALRQAYKAGELSRISRANAIDNTLNAVMKKDWVIHTKVHLNKPSTVVAYLGRYTHRTAISLSRIISVDDTTVYFKWKDYRDNQQKVMALEGTEFLRRFLLHILPKGLMRIRHYGYLANRVRVAKIKQIRQSLEHTPLEEPTDKHLPGQWQNDSEADKPCPGCKTGRLYLVGLLLSEKRRRQMMITA